MKCVVLVPGIMGSELVNAGNKQVWPPRLKELVFGYKRIAELMSNDVRADGIIRNVSAYSVYKSLLDDIQRCGYTEGHHKKRFQPYPYDWRRSNVEAAIGLANCLEKLDGLDEVVIIGHSMGGLVSRYLLESGQFNHRPWFDKVSTLITMGTPHFGAPQALAQLLGKEKTLGVAGKDLVKLASDKRYPAPYQLVPPADTAFTVPKVSRGQVPTKFDSFDAKIAATLKLSPDNIASAQDFWGALDLSKQPGHVAYFFFGCAAHKTTVRNEWNHPELAAVERRDAGDGTVPISSAIVPGIAHGFSMKKHSKIFEDRGLRRALYEFLDAPVGIHPQAADHADTVGNIDAFGISVDKDTYLKGEPIEIVASYNQPIRDPSESFQILALDGTTGDHDPDRSPANLEISFTGVEMTSFSVVVAPDLEVGLYELKPLREVDDPERTLFMVVEANG